MKILITGGAGFIGSALIRHLITATDYEIVNFDSLTYAASLASLAGVETNSRYCFEKGDIRDASALQRVFATHRPDGIMHLAAESHVDRSIDNPEAVVQTNIVGTYRLLDATLTYYESLGRNQRQHFRFHHISTDEVYGSLGATGLFTEDTAYAPNSPYSASKAASDHLVRAWCHTYGLPTIVSHCSNNYGPFQFPDKLIPLVIGNALEGRPVLVYGDGQNVRDWIYVDDHARALQSVFERGHISEHYNIGGSAECTNIGLVRAICKELDALSPDPHIGSREKLITFVEDRRGHDRRYAIDASKISREFGWSPQETLASGIRRTTEWYLSNAAWLESIRSQGYQGERLGLNTNATNLMGQHAR